MFESEPAQAEQVAAKKLFIVKNGAAKERLVRADRRSQVESYVLQDYEIRKATVDEALTLGRQGVEEESVG
jgi:hypothetical protein